MIAIYSFHFTVMPALQSNWILEAEKLIFSGRFGIDPRWKHDYIDIPCLIVIEKLVVIIAIIDH